MTWRRKPSTLVELWNGVRKVLEYGWIEDTCVHCCVSWEWRTVEVSPRHCVPLWRRTSESPSGGECRTRHETPSSGCTGCVPGQDRLDLGVAAVELAQTRAIPREGDDERLKRVARYLLGHPDYMRWYPVQEETNTVVLSTDAYWATCRETRRSNQGWTLQLGDHLIAAWSRVQPRIALSLGEAELYAGMRGVSETLGLFVHLMREFKSNK